MDREAFSVDEANERVGTTLRGKWRLVRLIGIGGMGAVYEARHRNGMSGAVKLLDPALARAKDFRERFLREGRLANDVAHDGVVRVLDDDETEEGLPFLVMELLSGATLDVVAMQRGGTIAPDELTRYAAQVLDTLEVAHARGIVHRDIKPENLFLTDEGVVKLLDFGIARGAPLPESQRVTQAGQPIGTPAFMSPEQARGRWEDVDARTDLYSLGATLFTLGTGETVHTAATVAELMVLVMTEPARPVRQVAPVPPALAAVIDKSLAHDKSARFEDAAAMRAALDLAYREMTGESLPDTPRPLARQTDAPMRSDAAHVLRARLATTRSPITRTRRAVAGAVAAVGVGAIAGVLSVAIPHAARHAAQAAPTVAMVALPSSPMQQEETHAVAQLDPAAPELPRPTPPPSRARRATSSNPERHATSTSAQWAFAMSRHGALFQRRY